MNVRSDPRPNILMISKDWGSTILWGHATSGGGMANYRTYKEFGFPPDLIERFDYWSAWYERYTPEKISEELDWERWDAYGLALAIDLKRFLGDKYVVYYGTEQEIDVVPFDVEWVPPRDDLDPRHYKKLKE